MLKFAFFYLKKIFLDSPEYSDVLSILNEIEKNKSPAWCGIFSISFSNKDDSLQQWVTYAKDSGVSIELDSSEHMKPLIALLISKKNSELLKHLEDETKKKAISLKTSMVDNQRYLETMQLLDFHDIYYLADSVLHNINYYNDVKINNSVLAKKIYETFIYFKKNNNAWTENKKEAYIYLQLIASYLKNKGFEGEGEIRIALFSIEDAVYKDGEKIICAKTEIKYQNLKGGVLRPFFEVKFCKEENINKSSGFKEVEGMLPLKSITVGPSANQQKLFDSIIHRLKFGEAKLWNYSGNDFKKQFNRYVICSMQRLVDDNEYEQKEIKNHRKEIIAALKLQWKENNPTSSEFKNVRGSIDDSIKEIVTKINKKNYFSKEGVWVKMSKIPYIN